jgi:hypothetical protein
MLFGIKWYWWTVAGVGLIALGSSTCTAKTKAWTEKIAPRHGWKNVRVVRDTTAGTWSLVVNTMSVETQAPMDVAVVTAPTCEALEAQAKRLAAAG